MPDLYAGGDGPHIQPAGPVQLQHVPDLENAAPYKLILLLLVTLIMLAGVTIFVSVYHSSRESCGILVPPKSRESPASSPESSSIFWYLVMWNPFSFSPIRRPCVLASSESTSGQSVWVSCLPSDIEARAISPDDNMDCLNPLYAREHEHVCRGKKAIFLNPFYGTVTIVPIPTQNGMGNQEGGGDFSGPHPAQSLFQYLAHVVAQEFPELKTKNKNAV
ncbi:uncharacterized protein [Dipodomys merriami]|uniref:uncharacterized protein n=1 Tax=Dipodomys merriami TaxID=94247 RepID=UPI003855D4F1